MECSASLIVVVYISLFILAVFGCELCELGELAFDVNIAVGPVRDHAVGAVLNPVFRISEIAAALRSQSVERTIAEHAVETIRVIR